MHNFWQHLLKIADWNLPIHPIPSYPMEMLQQWAGQCAPQKKSQVEFRGANQQGEIPCLTLQGLHEECF